MPQFSNYQRLLLLCIMNSNSFWVEISLYDIAEYEPMRDAGLILLSADFTHAAAYDQEKIDTVLA